MYIAKKAPVHRRYALMKKNERKHERKRVSKYLKAIVSCLQEDSSPIVICEIRGQREELMQDTPVSCKWYTCNCKEPFGILDHLKNLAVAQDK